MEHNRREFVRTAILGTAGLSVGGVLPGLSARSYARVLGANDRLNVAVMGVNGRGTALARILAAQDYCTVTHICDVDSTAAARCIAVVEKATGARPSAAADFRRVLEDRQLDAVVVAAPDHWHAPAALMAMKAGKHVYLEKPCSHSPREGEILVAAAARYHKALQMGNQRRSWPNVVKAIEELGSGAIGRPYFGRSWYTNKRESIGIGKASAVPEWLDWELWQGPAPRRPFKDNYVHYNWHWFWHWGTGEALNNGTHMIDLLRWGMGVDYPVRVSSNGGRYRFRDDWETPDTQVIGIDFREGLSMTWEGRSCNAGRIEGSSVGAMFYGETGSLLIGGGNGYTVFDLDGREVRKVDDKEGIDPRNTVGPAQQLDALHIRNFYDAIARGERLRSDIASGHKSTLLMQLGNIAQRVGRSLDVDPTNGHVLGDKAASRLWSRQYEKGWEMNL